MLWFARYSPLVLSVTHFTRSGIFFFLLLFFRLVVFRGLPDPLRGGTKVFLLFLCFLFRCIFFVFVFLFSFVSLFHNIMCMSCLPYPVWWHGIALSSTRYVLTTYIRGSVVSLWRRFVITASTYCISLRRIEKV